MDEMQATETTRVNVPKSLIDALTPLAPKWIRSRKDMSARVCWAVEEFLKERSQRERET